MGAVGGSEIASVPGAARSVALRDTRSWFLFTYTVECGAPLTSSTMLELKLDPLTVTVRPCEPAGALEGDTEVIVGTPLCPPSEINAQPVVEIKSSATAKVMLSFDIILSTSW